MWVKIGVQAYRFKTKEEEMKMVSTADLLESRSLPVEKNLSLHW